MTSAVFSRVVARSRLNLGFTGRPVFRCLKLWPCIAGFDSDCRRCWRCGAEIVAELDAVEAHEEQLQEPELDAKHRGGFFLRRSAADPCNSEGFWGRSGGPWGSVGLGPRVAEAAAPRCCGASCTPAAARHTGSAGERGRRLVRLAGDLIGMESGLGPPIQSCLAARWLSRAGSHPAESPAGEGLPHPSASRIFQAPSSGLRLNVGGPSCEEQQTC